MFTTVLTWLTDFTWWIENSIASIFLFGEYPYPREEDYK